MFVLFQGRKLDAINIVPPILFIVVFMINRFLPLSSSAPPVALGSYISETQGAAM